MGLRWRIRLHGDFELQVFDRVGSTWARLKSESRPWLERCWSRSGSAKAVVIAEFSSALAARLRSLALDEAGLFFVDGWETWGGGVPAPISDYVVHGPIKEAVAETSIIEVADLARTG